MGFGFFLAADSTMLWPLILSDLTPQQMYRIDHQGDIKSTACDSYSFFYEIISFVVTTINLFCGKKDIKGSTQWLFSAEMAQAALTGFSRCVQ